MSCIPRCPERRGAVGDELEPAMMLGELVTKDQENSAAGPKESAPPDGELADVYSEERWTPEDRNPNSRKLAQNGLIGSTDSPRWNQQLAVVPN